MTPDRWQQVDKLFQAVVELTPEERTRFLDAAGVDPELCREVETLLKSDEEGLALVEKPAFERAACLLLANQLNLETDQEIGHYRVLSLLGTGGMGEVYLAMDTTLNRKVALKLLPAEYTGNREWLDRFYQEARAASALNHPGIMTIHEISEVEGLHFIATEFIDGETLRHRLNPPGLKLNETLDIAIQVGNALAAAHRDRIVHRDIKPENIMLRPDGHVKVVDFGLARLPEQQSGGVAMGTPKYMSPEQTLGLEEDPGSDIFSFGVVLYEMVEGRAPLDGDTTTSLIRAIREEQPAPFSQVATHLSGELQRITEKLLQKDKAKRYSAMEEAVFDLNAFKNQLETGSRPERMFWWRIRHAWSLAALLFVIGIAYIAYVGGFTSRAPSNPLSVNRPIPAELATGAVISVNGVTPTEQVTVASISNPPSVNPVAPTERVTDAAISNPLSVNRLIPTERVSDAAISPNGKYLARVSWVSAKPTLWLRDFTTDRDEYLVRDSDRVWNEGRKEGTYNCAMTFSNDNRYLYFLPKGATNGADLYRIPVSGGKAEKILSNVASAVSFSPNGKEFTFVRQVDKQETALMIAQTDGSEERVLATRKLPEFFYPFGPAWSPDGKIVAAGIGTAGQSVIVAVQLPDGSEGLFTARKWDPPIGRIAWVADGTGIITTAAVAGDKPIWFIPYPDGEPRLVVTGTYESVTLSADSLLAAVRQDSRTSLWVASSDRLSEAKQIANGGPDQFRDVSWTPAEQIVYASSASGNGNIWIMNGDGSNNRALTRENDSNQLDIIHPTVSPDGLWIAFSAARAKQGIYNIWKVHLDGSDPVQLTHGAGEISPAWSPDSKWVVYTSGTPTDQWMNLRSVWKISIDGGPAVQLTHTTSMTPAVSPNGELVASWFKERPDTPWGIGFIPLNGGAPVKVILAGLFSQIRWLPDGSAVAYANSNIWSQPIDGSPRRKLTQFVSENIGYFAFSKSGSLVFTRASFANAPVLIPNLGFSKVR